MKNSKITIKNIPWVPIIIIATILLAISSALSVLVNYLCTYTRNLIAPDSHTLATVSIILIFCIAVILFIFHDFWDSLQEIKAETTLRRAELGEIHSIHIRRNLIILIVIWQILAMCAYCLISGIAAIIVWLACPIAFIFFVTMATFVL